MPTAQTGIRGLQETGSGLLAGYQGDSLTGLGLPSIVGLIQADNKAASLGYPSTVLYTTTQSGVYQITSGLYVYGVAGTANATIQPYVVYSSDDTGTPHVQQVGTAVSMTSQPPYGGGSVLIRASANTAIYGSTVFSAGATGASYMFSMSCLRLL